MENGPHEDETIGAELPAVTPRIWVGSLLDYNNGVLHGDWIEVDDDAQALTYRVQQLLAQSPTAALGQGPAEEWGILDYEHFGGLSLHEYESLEQIAAWAAGMRRYGVAFAAWLSLGPTSSDLAAFEDVYLGDFPSAADYVGAYVEDLGLETQLDAVVPAELRPYVSIDLDALAQDMQLSGSLLVAFHPQGVYLFRNELGTRTGQAHLRIETSNRCCPIGNR